MHHMSATPSISNSHLSALSVQPYLIRLQYLLICLREDRLCVPWLYSSESVVVSPDSRDVLAGTFSQDCIHRSAMQRLESHTGHFLRPPDFWRRKTDALVRTGAVVRMVRGRWTWTLRIISFWKQRGSSQAREEPRMALPCRF